MFSEPGIHLTQVTRVLSMVPCGREGRECGEELGGGGSVVRSWEEGGGGGGGSVERSWEGVAREKRVCGGSSGMLVWSATPFILL